jgi:hypothetical protein
MTKKIDEIDLHSKEVQDIMGRMPSWLIRNGIVMVVFLVMIILAGTWLFKYPDIVTAPAVVVAAADSSRTVKITCTIYLQKSGNGQVRIGQHVNLKFASYPYLEFGLVRGIVSGISLVPTGENYIAEVTLPNRMVTTFGKKLEFQHELKGTAEINTEDRRLLDRILKPVREVFGKRGGK